MTYRLSTKAATDIENIWLYTYHKWSVEQADKYVDHLFDEIEFLVMNPYAGKDFGQLRKNYRRHKVNAHLVFYRVNDDFIEIIRILHQQMDIENRLND